jgi:hypothetical protein
VATKRPSSTPDQRGAGDELHQGVERGERMTTSTGVPLGDGQNSLEVAERGPTLLEDSADGRKATASPLSFTDPMARRDAHAPPREEQLPAREPDAPTCRHE